MGLVSQSALPIYSVVVVVVYAPEEQPPAVSVVALQEQKQEQEQLKHSPRHLGLVQRISGLVAEFLDHK